MKPNNNYLVSFCISSTKVLTLLLFVALVFSSCKKDEDAITPLTEGKAPDFTLNSLDGSSVKLSDLSNKVVVLFFFGNSCPSCKSAAPSVESILNIPLKSRNDYMIIGIDQWNGNSASVQSFKTSTGVAFPLLLNGASVSAEYKTTYDRLVVIDKNGNIVFSGTQGAAADLATVKQKVEMLLGAPIILPPTDTTTSVKGDAPDFSLTSISDSVFKLSANKNKVVVLFFFGNSCPSCKSAAPSVESMLNTPYKSRNDYIIVGIDQWNGNSASVQSFKTSTGVAFLLLLNGASVSAEYKTTYDRLVVIDKSGNIAFSGKQGAASDIATVKQKVDMLLAN